MTAGVENRALGALTGLAVGDALGMPTQSLDRARIARLYGRLDGLVDALDEQPIAPGMPAGAVTDDTEQALLVADLLIDGSGRVEPRAFADALVRWESAMRSKGSLDLLGPSTKAAVSAIADGKDPSRAGLGGTTNGAAMRITPVAVAVPPHPPEKLLAAIHALSYVTHNSSIALAGAAAIAGAVSAGVDGSDLDDALAYGLALADRAAMAAPWVAGASIGAKSRWALRCSASLDEDALADFLVDVVGTSVLAQESIVAAIVIADRYRERPYDGLCFAARLGGDTDTVAAMAGAVLGAVHEPDVFGAETVRQVQAVSRLDLEPVVAGLLRLRGINVRESYDS
ncbi:MAG: ADP-ribosylglycohydrolase family protein [Actinomycetia bacterium]|nr:ADP-ribosylglycohydrolase family protein [Actinomycetes bacterium]